MAQQPDDWFALQQRKIAGRFPDEKWLRFGVLALWVLILGAIAVRLGIQPDRNSVFDPLFYDTGRTWNAGGNVYLHIQDFRYAPIVAAFFGLLARLPVLPAQYLWMIFNVVVLFAGIAGWLRTCAPRRLSQCQRWSIALLVTPLLVGNINNLQANPMMLGFMLLALVCVEHDRWWLAAAAIAAATMLKVYPITLGFILIVFYPWKLTPRLLIMVAIGALLPYALQSPHYVSGSYQQWVHGLAHEDRSAMGINVMYRDAGSLWVAFVGPIYSPYYRMFQVAAAAAVAAFTFWAFLWKTGGPGNKVTLAFLWTLLCGWILLAGPSTESATYMVAALPAAWLLVESLRAPRALTLRLLALAAFLLLLVGTCSSWFPFGRSIKAWGCQPLGVIAMVAALMLWRFSAPVRALDQDIVADPAAAAADPAHPETPPHPN